MRRLRGKSGNENGRADFGRPCAQGNGVGRSAV